MTTAAETPELEDRSDRPGPAPRLAVTSEPMVYDPEARVSYYRDLIFRDRDAEAAERLLRHGRQMDDVVAKRDRVAQRALARAGVESRVNPSRTDGQGGYFSPPLWLIEEFATASRAKRVLADLTVNLPLPSGVSQVNVPAISTGTDTEAEAADNAATPSRDVVDAAQTSSVVTIAGQADVALQLLEQSPAGAHLDWAFFQDLTEDYDSKLEAQIINGAGTGQTLSGIITNANKKLSYTTGSPTGAGLYTILGQAAAQLGDARALPPECWLMRTARWAWLTSAEDSQTRPFMVPDGVVGEIMQPPVHGLMGWPVFLDDAIPATLGAGANQDIVIVLRPSDLILMEAEPRTVVMEEVLSGTLGARLQLRNYAAFIGRRVTGAATVGGTGLVVQANF